MFLSIIVRHENSHFQVQCLQGLREKLDSRVIAGTYVQMTARPQIRCICIVSHCISLIANYLTHLFLIIELLFYNMLPSHPVEPCFLLLPRLYGSRSACADAVHVFPDSAFRQRYGIT